MIAWVYIVTECKYRCEVVEPGIDNVNQNESWIEFIVDYYREVTISSRGSDQMYWKLRLQRIYTKVPINH